MSHNDSETAGTNAIALTWWTPRRMKLGGLAGIIGGFGVLGVLGVAELSLGNTGVGIGPGAVGVLYPVWHILLAGALLAANARDGAGYGRGGRSVAILLALSLASYAGFGLILVAGRTMLGDLFVPIGVITGTAYLAIRLLAVCMGSVSGDTQMGVV